MENIIVSDQISELEDTISAIGQGGAAFILVTGDFGFGKTAVLDHLGNLIKNHANTYSSRAEEWDLEFGVIRRALRTKNLEDYMDPRPAKISGAGLVNHAGMKMCSVQRDDIPKDLDMDILFGMVSAVGNFVQDSVENIGLIPKDIERSFDRFSYRGVDIGKFEFIFGSIVAIIEGDITDGIRSDMNSIADFIEADCRDLIETWNGNEKVFEGLRAMMKSRLLDRYTGEAPVEDPKLKNLKLQSRLLEKLLSDDRTRHAFVLDDLQFSDAASIGALNMLSRNMKKGIIILAASELPAERLGLQNFTQVHLKGFGKEELAGLMSGHPRFREAADGGLAEFLLREVGGTPLVLVENLCLFDEIELDPKNWKEDLEKKKIKILKTSDDVIQRKLLALGPENYESLQLAAVIGNEFDTDLLEKVLGIYKQNMPDLSQINLIEKINGSYKFKDSRTRRALLNVLSQSQDKHLVVAQTLEEMCEEKDDKTTHQLARLFYETTDKEKAVEYLTKSADIFVNNANIKAAIDNWSKLLDLTDGDKKIEINRNICQFAFGIDLDLGIKYALNLIEDAQAQNKKEIIITAYNYLANSYARKQDFKMIEFWAEKAIELSQEINYNIGEFWARRYLATIPLKEKEAQSKLNQEKALEIAEKSNDESLIYGAHLMLAIWTANNSEFHESEKHNKIALQYTKKEDQIRTINNNLGWALQKQGKLDEALEKYAISLNHAEKSGNEFSIYLTTQNMAEVIAEKGDLETAIEMIEKCLTGFEKLGMDAEVSSCKIELCLLHAKLADNYKSDACKKLENEYARKRLEEKLPPILKGLDISE